MPRLCLLLALSLSACNDKPAAPEPDADGPLDPWRRQLADDTIYPVRDAAHIDPQTFRQALLEGRGSQREAVRAAVLASVEALPSGAMPAQADYQVRATFEHDSPVLAREVEALQVAVTADVRDVARRFASRNITIAMTREMELPTQEIGVWTVFFDVALPTVTRCRATDDALSICIDYGSLDVLVVDFMPDPDVAWLPHRVQWLGRQ